MSFDFSNKVVLVTGSSSGIGEDAVIAFAKLGAQVVVTGRDVERVAAVAKLCNEVSVNNLTALEVVADVAIDDDARRLIDATVSKFGQIDVLVNNAGRFARAEVTADNIIETLDSVHRLNVRALVLLTHLAAPHLIASKGNIINVSSVASTMPGIGALAYTTSKAAVDMATRVMALELTPKGVRVNAINPGLIDTPILISGGLSYETVDNYKSFIEKIYPARRVGRVEDTTAAILFLASDSASFISGTRLPVEGGYLCTTATTSFQATINKSN